MNMQRLLLVSNRLPVTVEKKKAIFNFKKSVGGLATGLRSFYQTYDSSWIGWCGLPANAVNRQEKRNLERTLLEQYNSVSVFLSKKDIRLFYSGFCNKTIWPLFHYFSDYTVYGNELWESYRHVNRLFAQAVIKVAKPGDAIWIHDYQLMLLPEMIREKLPNTRIGFFLHIPFPSYEIFRLLPWRKEIIRGVLGADLIGFHIYDYVRHFMSSVRRLLGYEHTFGQITLENRIVKVDAFPMGIHFDQFASAEPDPVWTLDIKQNCRIEGGCKVILSIDRLDYTKGISKRLEAFDCFLEKYPEYKRKVTLILVAVPSRTTVDQYKQLKQQVDELVGRINGKHGTIGWMPVWYLYQFMDFKRLVSLYHISDVALVTPLRDGMNLIAKEYLACKKDNRGVLILSEMAGAVSELSESIVVNPNSKHDVADAIQEALLMDEDEQVERNRIMKTRLARYNVETWARDFMTKLNQTKNIQREIGSKKLTQKIQKQLLKKYTQAGKRLIFLDYDGTLVPFASKPDKAKPDDEIIGLFKMLIRDPVNEVVIVSGRDRETLDSWFGRLKLGMSAEHGVWIKQRRGKWHMIEPIHDEWKSEIRPIFEFFVDRTPASFIEEKSFSLAWHYRKADTELGPLRAIELKETLLGLTANLNLVILEGNKVIEVKNGGVNKGRATLFWTSNRTWDFIMAIGDDWTDEDLFEAIPKGGYSIKVGLGITKAKYYLHNHIEVREFLRSLGNK
jgi:trehalose 6-phosphate synthase/phosphatase